MKTGNRKFISLLFIVFLALHFVNCPSFPTKFHRYEISVPEKEDYAKIKKLKIAVEVIEDEGSHWKGKNLVSMVTRAFVEQYQKAGFQVVDSREKSDLVSKTFLEFPRSSSGGGQIGGTEEWWVTAETFLKSKEGTVIYREKRTGLYSTSFFLFVFIFGGTFFTENGFQKSSANYAEYLVELISLSDSMSQFYAINSTKGKDKNTDHFRYTVTLKNGTTFQKVAFAIVDDGMVIADREGKPTVLHKHQIKSIKREK